MKRFLALAGVAGLMGFAIWAASELPGGKAFAITAPVQRWVSDQIIWHHTPTTSVPPDSSVIRHGPVVAGGYITSTSLDTSVAFPLNNMELNTSWLGQTTGVDTLALFSINLYPTGSTSFTAGTGDSLAIAVQVSMDGVNWAKVTPTVGGFAAGSIVNDGATQQNFNLSPPALSHKGFTVTYYQKTDILGRTNMAVGATAPTDGQFFGWRWVRVIVSPNRLNGEWGGWISYWSSHQYANQ